MTMVDYRLLFGKRISTNLAMVNAINKSVVSVSIQPVAAFDLVVARLASIFPIPRLDARWCFPVLPGLLTFTRFAVPSVSI